MLVEVKKFLVLRTVRPSGSDDIFIRTYRNYQYYIRNSAIILKTKELPSKFISPIIKAPLLKNNKIITVDIETLNKDGVLVPYLYCMYDGQKSYSFISTGPEPLFTQLLRRKYRGYTVYAHNLSKFDIIFLFKYLANLNNNKKFTVSAIIKDGNIISIKISNRNGVNIIIRDSYLLLTGSLLKLSKTFNCNILKGIEPVLIYSDSLNDEEKYYAHKDVGHYNKDIKLIYAFNEWKELIIDYCKQDCTVLFDILIKFKKLVYDKWNLNIEDYPTISSLAFAIYRRHYLPENKISITRGKVFDFIRESYTGGSTDMYKPSGQNIYAYDVNSLYPFVMKDNEYPPRRGGPINEFEGDITILGQDKYWI